MLGLHNKAPFLPSLGNTVLNLSQNNSSLKPETYSQANHPTEMLKILSTITQQQKDCDTPRPTATEDSSCL